MKGRQKEGSLGRKGLHCGSVLTVSQQKGQLQGRFHQKDVARTQVNVMLRLWLKLP